MSWFDKDNHLPLNLPSRINQRGDVSDHEDVEHFRRSVDEWGRGVDNRLKNMKGGGEGGTIVGQAVVGHQAPFMGAQDVEWIDLATGFFAPGSSVDRVVCPNGLYLLTADLYATSPNGLDPLVAYSMQLLDYGTSGNILVGGPFNHLTSDAMASPGWTANFSAVWESRSGRELSLRMAHTNSNPAMIQMSGNGVASIVSAIALEVPVGYGP